MNVKPKTKDAAQQRWRWRKKFALALLFWGSGTALAFKVAAGLGEFTVFTATVLAMFKVADVADKHLNGGNY